MCLEGLDGAFSHIGAMDVGRNELEGSVPVLGNGGTVCLAGFIVENLVFDNVAFVSDAGLSLSGCTANELLVSC